MYNSAQFLPHRLNYMLGYKFALDQDLSWDLSIGAMFRRKKYLCAPYILSTRPNCIKFKE